MRAPYMVFEQTHVTVYHSDRHPLKKIVWGGVAETVDELICMYKKAINTPKTNKKTQSR